MFYYSNGFNFSHLSLRDEVVHFKCKSWVGSGNFSKFLRHINTNERPKCLFCSFNKTVDIFLCAGTSKLVGEISLC